MTPAPNEFDTPALSWRSSTDFLCGCLCGYVTPKQFATENVNVVMAPDSDRCCFLFRGSCPSLRLFRRTAGSKSPRSPLCLCKDLCSDAVIVFGLFERSICVSASVALFYPLLVVCCYCIMSRLQRRLMHAKCQPGYPKTTVCSSRLHTGIWGCSDDIKLAARGLNLAREVISVSPLNLKLEPWSSEELQVLGLENILPYFQAVWTSQVTCFHGVRFL